MRKLISYFSLGAVVLLASCEKGTEYTPASFGPASPMVGVVIATDEFQHPLPADQQPSIDISIAEDGGTGTSSASAQGGTQYRLENVSGGSYNMSFSAAGFGTTVRPGVNHAGGSETAVDTTYVIRLSTTEIATMDVAPKVELTRTRILDEMLLPANTLSRVQPAGDTIIFVRRQGTTLVNIVVIPKQDTTLIYPKDTAYYDPRFIETLDTYLNAKVKLNQPSIDTMQRGALIVFSSDPNVTAENYMLLQASLQSTFTAAIRSKDTLSFKIPLSRLESSGIINSTNRRVFVAAYGISGTYFAYGSSTTADRRFFVYPARNPNRSEVKQVDF